MKNLNLFFALALGLALLVTSCSKEEIEGSDSANTPEKTSFTVRPDFATIDDRPADVIAQHMVNATLPVEVTKDTPKGGKYALVIGISDYTGTSNDLTYCDEDADDWKARLVTEGYTVTIIKDMAATKVAIENAVNTLASLSVAGNEIAFVYSGHGSRGSIISSDLSYIASTWFKTKFANSTSTKMFFTFDACQIGAMTTDLNKAGRVIATASNKTLYGYDGDASMANGVFTYYQMKAFDQLGYIYAEPVCNYAKVEMGKWAKLNKVRVAPMVADYYTGDLNL